MKIQDLTYINTTAGRPSPYMTNEKWQEMFQLMKLIISPTSQRSIHTYNGKMLQSSYIDDGYYGDTLHQARTRLLNDNLRQIRQGEIDYVYYIYNIVELLQYEHDRLKSRYNQREQYFEIWLENRAI